MREPDAADGLERAAALRRARRLSRGFALLVALVFGLIVLGALVRAHDAGLACPDWPRCFGVWLPAMDLRVGFEWTHRLMAGSVALIFAGLALATLGRGETRGALGAPLALAAALLAAQIVLGGLTVLLGLAPWTVTAHLVTGNAFAATLLVVVLRLSELGRPRFGERAPARLRVALTAVGGLLAVQLIYGGLVASNYAGLVCPEWPTCQGGVWFPSWSGPVGLQVHHRLNGYLLVSAVAVAWALARRSPRLRGPTSALLFLVLLQLAVGVANVLLGLPVEVTGLHSALAAGLVLTTTWAVREAWRVPHPLPARRPRVVVVGAGFGGLALARSLRNAPVDVLLVDRQNFHAFLPLLYQVATAGLSAQDVSHPVRTILRGIPNARFRMAEVTGGDPRARILETAEGQRIPYDVLVLAGGSTTAFFGNESVERHALRLHHADDAIQVRNRVITALERADANENEKEREALLGFVVVGGGPTGVELAGMLAELRQHVLPREFPRIAEGMRVTLVEGQDRLLPALPERLSRRALDQIGDLGVDVRLDAFVEAVDEDGVRLRGGERLRARTVVWAAGIRGVPLGEALGLATDRGGRIRVGPTLHVPGHPELFVIGDLAGVEGASVPQVAPAAIQQGELVAANLTRRLAGEPLAAFRYKDLGTLATIGRNRAVAHVFGLQIGGRLAWWAWLLIHLVKLVGFRNRLVVFVNWIYHYFSYDLSLRAVIGPRDLEHGRR